jgi:hypothetical protein
VGEFLSSDIEEIRGWGGGVVDKIDNERRRRAGKVRGVCREKSTWTKEPEDNKNDEGDG